MIDLIITPASRHGNYSDSQFGLKTNHSLVGFFSIDLL